MCLFDVPELEAQPAPAATVPVDDGVPEDAAPAQSEGFGWEI